MKKTNQFVEIAPNIRAVRVKPERNLVEEAWAQGFGFGMIVGGIVIGFLVAVALGGI